jgi:hypothetical protein
MKGGFNMKKKVLCLLIITTFLIGLFPLSGMGLDVVPQTAEDAAIGKPYVKRDGDTTSFEALRYPITSTGASSGTRYKTIQTTITIGGYSATYDIGSLGATPAPGQTINETIVISAESLAEKMGIPQKDVEYMLNSGEKAYMSSVVAIVQNGVTVGTYNDYSSLANAMRSYGFGQEDINDVATRWGQAEDRNPPVNLRATSIRIIDRSTNQQVGTLEPGKEYLLQASFKNDASISGNVNLRAYSAGDGQDFAPLNAQQSYLQTPNLAANESLTWNWGFTAGQGNQTFMVTINYDYQGSNSFNPEKFNGRLETTYDDNRATTRLLEYIPPPPSFWENLFPGRDVKRGDLAVTSVSVVDSATGNQVSSPAPNQSLNVKASFISTFDVGGWARIRLYRYQVDFKRLDQVDSFTVFFEPGATIEHEWPGRVVGSGQYQFIAAINVYNNGNDPETGWEEEKFNGEYEEPDYNNNHMAYGLTGTESPRTIPSPTYYTSGPGYYPPITVVKEAVYETVPVYGWKKVRFVKAETQKPQVRLID